MPSASDPWLSEKIIPALGCRGGLKHLGSEDIGRWPWFIGKETTFTWAIME